MAEYENSRIIEFLAKNNASINTISKKQLANLEKVDAEIQKRLESLKQARNTIKLNAINIAAIAKETGISNKTFYNNTLLKKFVDSYSEKSEGKSIAESEYIKLKEQNEAYEQQIQQLIIRDIDLEKQQHEIDALNREIKTLRERNQTLQEQCEELMFKKNLSSRSKTSKVVPFISKSEDDKDL